MRFIGIFILVLILAGCAGKGRISDDEAAKLPEFMLEELPGGLSDILKKAKSEANEGELDRADETLDSGKDKYANYPQIELNQALLDIQREEHEDALEHIEKALVARPNYPPALNLKGYVSRLEGDFDTAKAAYQQSISVEPKYTKPYLNLGILADLYLQDYELALDSFERYLERVDEDEKVSGWIVELKRRMP
ncbi:tetratricopeptide repeat protein [Pleionea sediminis]|uniref:tetratricopeptide repeat protein n=1 Tax=Pleionea sediminis TaxID=2569479 RepID=UPI0011864FBD|nr:tetratricopeptide repeat protein [Pleionea sediminis]